MINTVSVSPGQILTFGLDERFCNYSACSIIVVKPAGFKPESSTLFFSYNLDPRQKHSGMTDIFLREQMRPNSYAIVVFSEYCGDLPSAAAELHQLLVIPGSLYQP